MDICVSLQLTLVEEIQLAFASIRIPEVKDTSAGSASHSFEYIYCQEFFRGRSWKSIGYDELLENYPSGVSASVTFLSELGFFYYLPLFMSCCLERFHDSGDLVDSLLHEFRANTSSSYEGKNFSLLSLEQKQCIAEFLQYLVTCRAEFFPINDSNDWSPHVMLSGYWFQHVKSKPRLG